MITNINYNHFYYFWVVSNAGSIAKASKTLHLTPQTISAQISMLEQRLGKALFIRKGRQLVLSDYGRISKQYADDMFAIAEEWLETTQGNDTYLKTLKVGISDALPKSLVTRWLAPIINSDSNIKLTCIDGKQEELLSQLAIHKLDLLLSDTPADNNYNLKVFATKSAKVILGFMRLTPSPGNYSQTFPQPEPAANGTAGQRQPHQPGN
ncbi:LysR family transcriptional regulator [Aliamphritea spongicola]|nr:LysR family transcriptional regulator [Aliamphritea spongicola]